MKILACSSDDILVERTLNGDSSAFGDLIRRHKDAAFAIAFSRVKNFDEAQDIAQDAFIKAYVTLGTLKDGSRFGGWLSRITVNLCNAKLRKKRTISVDPEDLDKGEMLSASCRAPRRPDEIYEQKELRELITKAMGKLGAKTREAVALFYINGYSYEEISAYLSVPVNTLKARLNLGRKRLREELMDIVEDTLKAQKPDETFTERVLTELSLGFPEGFLSLAGREHDENHTVILSTKSRDPEKARLIALTMRREDARAAFGFHGADSEEVRSRRETYDFLTAVLGDFGIPLARVVLKEEEGGCYAEVLLRKGKTTKEIRTRPSIGLSLAYRMKAPVWATPGLIQQGKVSEGGLPAVFEEDLEAIKEELLNNASKVQLIDLAFQHGLRPEEGVEKVTLRTDKGEMMIEGGKVISFDFEAHRCGLDQIQRNIGSIEIWCTNDGKRCKMHCMAEEHNRITIDFTPFPERAAL